MWKLESASGHKNQRVQSLNFVWSAGQARPGGDRDVQPEGLPGGMGFISGRLQGYIRFYRSYEDILKSLYLPCGGRRPGEQIICQVIFHEKAVERHTYRTEDESLEVGDQVIVPARPIVSKKFQARL